MKLNIQLFAYTKKEWKDLPSKAKNLNPDKYYSYMIIDHYIDKDIDTPIELGKIKRLGKHKS